MNSGRPAARVSVAGLAVLLSALPILGVFGLGPATHAKAGTAYLVLQTVADAATVSTTPSPTPSPGASLSATTSPTTAPSVTNSPSASPDASVSGIANSPTATPSPRTTRASGRSATPAATPALGAFTVTATQAVAHRLVYLGIGSLRTPQGPIEVLGFRAARMDATGFAMSTPCEGGVAWHAQLPATQTLALGQTVTFDAVSLTATIGGQVVVYTPQQPPTAKFPDPAVLSTVTLLGTGLTAGLARVPNLTQTAVSC